MVLNIETIKTSLEKEIGHSNFMLELDKSCEQYIVYKDLKFNEHGCVTLTKNGRVKKNSYRNEYRNFGGLVL